MSEVNPFPAPWEARANIEYLHEKRVSQCAERLRKAVLAIVNKDGEGHVQMGNVFLYQPDLLLNANALRGQSNTLGAEHDSYRDVWLAAIARVGTELREVGWVVSWSCEQLDWSWPA